MQNPCSGQPVTLFLILGQRKQDDRWVKLDETLRSHSPSMNGHLQKRLDCVQLNAFTGAHPLRSLTRAARPVLAVLRHIRSTVRCLRHVQRSTLAAEREIGEIPAGSAGHSPENTCWKPLRFQADQKKTTPMIMGQIMDTNGIAVATTTQSVNQVFNGSKFTHGGTVVTHHL